MPGTDTPRLFQGAFRQLNKFFVVISVNLYLTRGHYISVEWEPWHSMKMHQLPVDNFIVYYLVDDKERTVTVARIFYGGRDIEGIINSNK